MKQRLGITLSQRLRHRFLEWCSRKASLEVCRQYLRKLEEIDAGKDVEASRWHVTAYKRLAKMLCEEGSQRACQEFKRVKSRKSHFDPYVPSNDEILEAIRAPEPLGTVYRLLVESGLRLTEVVRILELDTRVARLDGFVRVELAWYRGSKKAYWGYFLEEPPRLKVSYDRLQDLREALGLIPFKYTRKWQATQLVKLGCNDIQIDFIQGRAPENILRRNYAEILEAADDCYRKYAEWLREWL
ncbi:MAG: hypothetical protein F7C08_00665 [Desulfurococcales archaeon]|nr:hypothetical protein [Desulfurococcales archaeon]